MHPGARPALPLLTVLLVAAAARAGEVTIYRCTDAHGQLALRDTPCRAGETQQTRSMVRPVDPPPRPAAATSAPAPAAPPPTEIRYVVTTPPQPLYECVDPDGGRYTADTDEGRPRWEPLWVLGYPAVRPRGTGGVHADIAVGGGDVRGRVRVGSRPRPPADVLPAYPAGQWVRDECHRLPQAEVCDRLRDDRHERNRRWNIAQPSERALLDGEIRALDARLANDCGVR